MKIQAILVGAGVGLRMGDASSGKLFVPLAGRPLVLHSLSTFQDCKLVERIYLVVNPQDRARLESEVLPGASITKLEPLVTGGEERQDSVFNVLRVMRREPGLVLVHDVARPLATGDLIQRVVTALERSDGAVPVIPLRDTVKEVAGGWVVRTWDREKFRAVQTPQGFKLEALLDAHERAARERFRVTDDAALLEHYRYSVGAVPGDRMNLKVTFPEDVAIAEALLSARES